MGQQQQAQQTAAHSSTIRDHFAAGVDGYKFDCGTIYNPAMVAIKTSAGMSHSEALLMFGLLWTIKADIEESEFWMWVFRGIAVGYFIGFIVMVV